MTGMEASAILASVAALPLMATGAMYFDNRDDLTNLGKVIGVISVLMCMPLACRLLVLAVLS